VFGCYSAEGAHICVCLLFGRGGTHLCSFVIRQRGTHLCGVAIQQKGHTFVFVCYSAEGAHICVCYSAERHIFVCGCYSAGGHTFGRQQSAAC